MLTSALLLTTALLQTAPIDTANADLRATAAERRVAAELIASLQSPFCPGLTLPACPSWHADTLRRSLRRRVYAGESPAALRQEMASRYGQAILGEPSWQGFDVLGWIGPGVLLLAGIVGVVVFLRRKPPASAPVMSVPPPPPAPGSEDARLVAQLAEELRASE
ncbi:MAG: cytochrome c-type biogenesis protein CcmH [Gemmatimonadetes bacterium]|nr:cytochrome c-type biogenesis protein CcmH [Gemmatimonadota bacterium]